MITPQRLTEIKRRLSLRTQGKVISVEVGRLNPPRFDLFAVDEAGNKKFLFHFHEVQPKQETNLNWGADAEFHVHAGEDIADLLNEVQALQEELRALKGIS